MAIGWGQLGFAVGVPSFRVRLRAAALAACSEPAQLRASLGTVTAKAGAAAGGAAGGGALCEGLGVPLAVDAARERANASLVRRAAAAGPGRGQGHHRCRHPRAGASRGPPLPSPRLCSSLPPLPTPKARQETPWHGGASPTGQNAVASEGTRAPRPRAFRFRPLSYLYVWQNIALK